MLKNFRAHILEMIAARKLKFSGFPYLMIRSNSEIFIKIWKGQHGGFGLVDMEWPRSDFDLYWKMI